MNLPSEDQLTPLFKQWRAIKQDHPDVLVLFRLGDFYEMFGEDAETGARELELTLTSRECGPRGRIPMCGVPHHAVDKYLAMLVHKGYRVAIVEQTEDPKKAKGLVRREVTRVVSPGTLLEDELLDGAQHNFLLAVARAANKYGVALVDISTGDFLVTEPEPVAGSEAGDDTSLLRGSARVLDPLLAALIDEVMRVQPSEILLPSDLAEDQVLYDAPTAGSAAPITVVEEPEFEFRTPGEHLREFFGVDNLDGFGCQDMPAAQAAAALAIRYLKENRLEGLPHLSGLTTYHTSQYMVIDATTRRNLELERTAREGSRQGTVLWLLDKTRTPMGRRLIAQWLRQPLLDVAQINQRLDAVENLVGDRMLADGLAEQLGEVYDLERLISRTAAGTANARDLRALCDSLAQLPQILESAAGAQANLLKDLVSQVDGLQDLHDLLDSAVTDDPPVLLTEGGLVKKGYSDELDELRDASAGGRRWIAELEDTERARTGIKSLKVGYNKVFGYYLEVTNSNLPRVPEDYQRKQTLSNAERFITPELKEQEARVLGADEKSQQLEYELFCALRDQVAEHTERVLRTARALAALDVLAALAEAAIEYNYVKPEVEDSDRIQITDGRHPVVERTQPEPFVPNDAYLDCDSDQLLIITGPNMAGKSTYLRQVALICLLAQMGSFVPAREARLGLVDRIFTRVGASDELAMGRSTFMVEMTEAANILHNATDRSLIILDEIGRGTSTFDGLSIAWAVAEYISRQIGAKTLFATHYHHLNELAEILPRVKNYRITVKEQGEEIIFLRKIMPGGTDRSYGIQVGRLAGLPEEVINRALEVLRRLEQEDLGSAVAPSAEAARQVAPTVQMQLFAAAPDPIIEELQSLDLDTMSPIEALMKLKELREKSEEHDAG